MDDEITFCLFLGYPRSGHSLVGALLDAHPHMVVAHEAQALRIMLKGYTVRQMYAVIIQTAHVQATCGCMFNEYSYAVLGQWQGRFDMVKVLGDKDGEDTTNFLMDDPNLLDRVADFVQMPLKLIHVVRNPFDNIASIYRRAVQFKENKTLNMSIEHYFGLAKTVRATLATLRYPLHEMRHEDFVDDPVGGLKALCTFLGVEPLENYLHACAGIVRESPNPSRLKITWQPEQKAAVAARIKEFDFLHGYSF